MCESSTTPTILWKWSGWELDAQWQDDTYSWPMLAETGIDRVLRIRPAADPVGQSFEGSARERLDHPRASEMLGPDTVRLGNWPLWLRAAWQIGSGSSSEDRKCPLFRLTPKEPLQRFLERP